MKKSIFAKIGAAAVVLTLVTSSLVGGTFAKYTSSANATANATVAKWNVAFKEGEDGANNFTKGYEFTLQNDNEEAKTTSGTIAPGSTGQIQLAVDGTGTQVGFTYEITANVVDLGGIPLKFYSDVARDTEHEISLTGDIVSLAKGEIGVDDNTKDASVTIYWAWDTTAEDSADTTLGEKQEDVKGTIALSLSATQITRVEPATP